jgi:hypothetical protein
MPWPACHEKILGFAGQTSPFAPAAPNLLSKVAPMEAERLNSLKNQLADLTSRVVELRRYL